jgi:hypothetical protein
MTSLLSRFNSCHKNPLLAASVLLLGVLALPQSQAHADAIGYNVNFASLGSLAGSTDYNLDFQLIANAPPNNSTTVSFSNFNYGSGGSGPSSLTSLSDTSPFEESMSPFTAGSSLSFNVLANYTPETSPDVLSFGLFSTSTGNNTSTAASDGFSYFTIDFSSATPTVRSYAGTNPAFAAPVITATPEPATWAMMVMGVGALGVLGFKRRKDEASV